MTQLIPTITRRNKVLSRPGVVATTEANPWRKPEDRTRGYYGHGRISTSV